MATYKSIAYAPISEGGSMVLLSSQTASNDSTLSFTSGIDSTYKEYIFKFIHIHSGAASGTPPFQFQCSTDGGSNYNTTVTSSAYYSYHEEDNSASALAYYSGADQAQGTAFEWLSDEASNANDECVSGKMHIFNPSNTTFVKQFSSIVNSAKGQNIIVYKGGYFNTTSAINAIQFKFSSDDIDEGIIKMYGVN